MTFTRTFAEAQFAVLAFDDFSQTVQVGSVKKRFSSPSTDNADSRDVLMRVFDVTVKKT